MNEAERHPLKPFLPEGARLLMLGSFPPQRKRWVMEFFFPNFQNDMWRIMGLCFHGDKQHFVDTEAHTYRLRLIKEMLREKGIALYDTATAVVRTKDNASDKDLLVVEATDLQALIDRLPQCCAVCATGQKAAELIAAHFNVKVPPTGTGIPVTHEGRTLTFFRMPSSSRAYPLSVEKKAEAYNSMFKSLGILQTTQPPKI